MLPCGYYQLVDPYHRKTVGHRYLTDFGYVILPRQPDLDDSALLQRMQRFAHERWLKGEDAPFKWEGDL